MNKGVGYDVKDKVCIVTGAASGIGRAIALKFAKMGAKSIIVADIDMKGGGETAKLVRAVAPECDVMTTRCDVSSERGIRNTIVRTEMKFGCVDVFVSNAGILSIGGLDVSNDEWDRIWKINSLSHVWAARHLAPRWAARKDGGYFVVTASAAGLMNQVGSLAYATTKHAAVAIAEWLSMSHRSRGFRVSCLCPQAVDTAMTKAAPGGGVAGLDGVISPERCAQDLVEAMKTEQFLVLPHKRVAKYMLRKAGDVDRWLRGMRRMHEKFAPFLPSNM